MKDKYLITHYLPLVAVLVATLVGFVIFRYDRALKISLTVAAGVSYLVWGIIHHYIHKDLNTEIVIEYLVICIFGVMAVVFLID
jgi:hypothetical protein